MQPDSLLKILRGDGFPCKILQALLIGPELFLEKFMGRFLDHRWCIDKVEVGKIQGIAPNAVASHHAVAAVGDHDAGQKVVPVLDAEVKATPDKGADDRLQKRIPPGDGFPDIPSDSEGDASGGGNKFQRNKRADIADRLCAFGAKFPGANAIISVLSFHLCHDAFFFVAHETSSSFFQKEALEFQSLYFPNRSRPSRFGVRPRLRSRRWKKSFWSPLLLSPFRSRPGSELSFFFRRLGSGISPGPAALRRGRL